MKKGYFIIIRGPLGIGKTTISKKLAKCLNAKYISIDQVLDENGLDKENNNFTSEDFIKANKIVIKKIKRDLNKGRIIIFDGCFYFKEQIQHLKKSINTKNYIFNLKAPLKTCIKRDSKRKKVYGKKNAKEVYALVSRFDCGITVNINNKNINESVKLILKKLK